MSERKRFEALIRRIRRMTRDILNFGLEIKRLIDDCQIPIADVRLIGAGLTFKLTFSKILQRENSSSIGDHHPSLAGITRKSDAPKSSTFH